MTTQYLDGLNPDGTTLGQSTSTKVSFYGNPPVDQPATVASVATAASVISTSSSAWAYASSAQANAIITAINAIITNLEELGLMADS